MPHAGARRPHRSGPELRNAPGRAFDSAYYAYKDNCADDKRGVFAVITDEGRKHYQDARATYADVLSSALNTASADDQLTRAVQALRSAA